MSSGPNFLSYVTADPDYQKLIGAAFVGSVLVFLGGSLSKGLKNSSGIEKELIPQEKPGLFGVVDFALEAFIKFFDSILGSHNRKHLPFVASLFFFIFISNLLGLIPGVPAITTTVWVTVSMAILVFVYFNWYGVKEQGLVGYLKHFCGPLLIMAPIIFPVEMLSVCMRVLTLNLRLYWNITADHMVLDIFTELLGPILPIPFYLLGTFVSFMQAFVFATLTMIYILLAIDHGEGEHH